VSPFLFDPTKLSDWRGLFANEEGQLTEAAERLLTIIGIVAGLVILDLVVRWFIRRAKNRVVARMVAARPAEAVAIRGRLDTIAATVNWGISIFLVFLGAGLVLGALGLDVTTLVAGVGVVGVALGLGAQMLVRDVINGLFILLENQYQVGDVVQVAGVSGQVIEINPRRTVLRDLDGNVHSVPNSAITVATNMTPGTSRINLNISVAYEEDVDRAIRIINEECARLAEERRADIIEAPRVLRVDDLGESGLSSRCSATCAALPNGSSRANSGGASRNGSTPRGSKFPTPTGWSSTSTSQVEPTSARRTPFHLSRTVSRERRASCRCRPPALRRRSRPTLG
jgi:moderate conductance mechanosensitive channel